MNLSCLVRDEERRRSRCASLVDELSSFERETITACNVCGAVSLVVVGASDRYGLLLRSGMCLNCGLIFLIDRFTADGYARFYRDYYRPLVSAYLNRPQTAQAIQAEQKRYARTLLETFRGFFRLHSGATLLDVGGSTGVVASEFVKEYDLSAMVLDPSPDELDVARAAGHRTICSLFETWEGNGEQFDLILCCRTIDHFLDLKGSLIKLLNLCKPSGYLLIDIIDVEAVRKSKGMLERAIKVDHPFYLCNEIAPVILASVGFQVMYSEIVGDSWRVTYLCRPSSTSKTDVQVPRSWMIQRLRDLQQNRAAVIEARRRPCDWRDAGRRRAYYFKKRLFGNRA